MNKLTPFLLGLALAVGGCAGPFQYVEELEKIHRDPRPGEACLSNPYQVRQRYRTEIVLYPEDGLEEIEDPVNFCMDRVDSLRGIRYRDPYDTGTAVYALTYAATLSPASIVRADALRALRRICSDRAGSFSYTGTEIDQDEWKSVTDTWMGHALRVRGLWTFLEPEEVFPPEKGRIAMKSVRNPSTGESWKLRRSRNNDRRRRRDAREEGLTDFECYEIIGVLETFKEWKFASAGQLRETLGFLAMYSEPAQADYRITPAYGEALHALTEQALYLSAREGLTDPNRQVRLEAIRALAMFPPSETAPYLAEFLETCFDGPLRILVLRSYVDQGLTPPDLGGRLMTEVRKSIEFSDPGVVYHALALLKSLTGIESDDPGFWRKWWDEYLPEHADELSACAPGARAGRPRC